MMLLVKPLTKLQELLDFGYPGGPKVDRLAEQGKAIIELPKPHFNGDTMDFSFSGIKTAVINLHHRNPNINKADLCASFQKTVTETLMDNVRKAINVTGIKTIALAGGVSANLYIREKFMNLEKENIKVYMPDLKICTDNGAMIAYAGLLEFMSKGNKGISLKESTYTQRFRTDEVEVLWRK